MNTLLTMVVVVFGVCPFGNLYGAKYPSKALNKQCRKLGKKTEKKLEERYNVVVQAPFVVAGNMSKETVKEWCDNTVYRASKALWHKFFSQRPKKPIRIFVLSGATSYQHVASKLYGDNNPSHFGYYRSSDRTMVMNIDTGGGTLVHELTHALMEADFPQAPVWFTEAIGSLFEQCSISEVDIRGLLNWRFPRLRKAARNDKLIPFKKLFNASRSDFDGSQSGLLYAESRYLALYLQRHNHLTKYYSRFRDNYSEDSTGAQALEKVTGKSLKELQKKWKAWILRVAERQAKEDSE